MKKFIIVCVTLFLLLFLGDYFFYHMGVYIDTDPGAPVVSFTKTEGKQIYLDQGNGYEPFEIKGVDMGSGIPGHFATDYAIDKETYLRWFGMIKDMGANTIRVYTILSPSFYEAVYEYNTGNDDPLYVIHGLWVNDYVHNSHVDAYDDSFLQTLLDDSRTLVDVLHGKRKLEVGRGLGSGSYTRDISPWVIGYILGVEWEDVTVAYTNHMREDWNSYTGAYMSTTKDASPFEAFLARLGDNIVSYESGRYKQQRLVAFSNWPTTDPFDYPERITKYFKKSAKVDVEHIKMEPAFIGGTFASYHIYPYYPDYLNYMADPSIYADETGQINTYAAYLKMVNAHHSIPVVISEFGVPTSRGIAQLDVNTGRSQGHMSEKDQGQALIDSYHDIKNAGCAGSIIFTWQDEWFKRTWNTMHAVDLTKTPFWSDYQTNEQYFGLLSFDPGKEKSVCYVDGDVSEWSEEDVVLQREGTTLSIKYDEKFLYFRIHRDGFSKGEKLYLPIDLTPKSGSNYCENLDAKFQREADFVIAIDGKEESRIFVQERYNVLRAMYGIEIEHKNPYFAENVPDRNSPVFEPIQLILQTFFMDADEELNAGSHAELFETGKLCYGNANPDSPDFDSLADFCFGGEQGDDIELKIPWQLLNFSNPSEMMIHDDYYAHYGVENMKIKEMYVGVGSADSTERIAMVSYPLKGWGSQVTYHERLKSSYYIMQKLWREDTAGN